MNILVIIPARKNSKRCIGKNTRLLDGIPLINWTLNLQILQQFKTGCVTTNINEILNTCENYRYDGIKRPNNLCQDNSTEFEFIKHTLTWYRKRGQTFDDVAVLYPTTPFKRSETLVKIFKQWSRDRKWVNQLRTVRSIKWEPEKIWYEGAIIDENYIGCPSIHSRVLDFRSSLKQYKQVPFCYIYKVNKLNYLEHYFYQPVSKFVIDDPVEAHDINTDFDFKIAEWLVQDKLNE